jgi:hypothetical protein
MTINPVNTVNRVKEKRDASWRRRAQSNVYGLCLVVVTDGAIPDVAEADEITVIL